MDTKELEVAIMDNYLLSHFHKIIKREPVRVQSNLEQPINYGLVMAPNSNKLAACFRDFVRNNPQDIFDIIRSNLNPLKVRMFAIHRARSNIGLPVFVHTRE